MSRREILLSLALVGMAAFTIGRWSSSAPVLASHAHAPSISVQVVSSGTVGLSKGTMKTVTASCPAGFHVAGGGTYASSPNVIHLTESLPEGTTGWKGRYAPQEPGYGKVEAVCFKLNQ